MTSRSTRGPESDDEDYEPSPPKKSFDSEAEQIPDEKKRQIIAFSKGKKGRLSIGVIQNRFGRWITNMSMIHRWEAQFEKHGGSVRAKQKTIFEQTVEKYEQAHESGMPIHEIDIRVWALEAAASQDIEFKASPNWISNFKKKNRISSRKVTHWVSKYSYENEPALIVSATEFHLKVRQLINDNAIVPEHVWNADQSGVNYELTILALSSMAIPGQADNVFVQILSYIVELAKMVASFLTTYAMGTSTSREKGPDCYFGGRINSSITGKKIRTVAQTCYEDQSQTNDERCMCIFGSKTTGFGIEFTDDEPMTVKENETESYIKPFLRQYIGKPMDTENKEMCKNIINTLNFDGDTCDQLNQKMANETYDLFFDA
ncbi:hypothetical protein HDE_11194 [Halotydeus destructor]|nr:hypothetical protein HDE_11194 [Halotydeus destructor]